MRCLEGYRSGLTWVLRHQPLTLAFFFAIAIGTGVLFSVMSKGFLPADDNGQILVFTEAATGRVFPGDGRHAAAGRADRQGESLCRGRDVLGGRGRTQRVAQRRAHLRGAEASRGTAQCRYDRAAIARTAVARYRHKGLRSERSRDPHRRPADQEHLPVHAAGHRYRRPLPVGAAGRSQAAHTARPRRCHQRPADREAASHGTDRPQQGIGAWRLGTGDREHALRRLRPATGVDDLCADQPVLGRHGAGTPVSDRRVGALAALRPIRDGRAGTAEQRRRRSRRPSAPSPSTTWDSCLRSRFPSTCARA